MRNRHPVRRVVLAGAATVSGIVLLLALKPSDDPGSVNAAGTAPGNQAAQQVNLDGVSGTATGDAVDTQYGPVQVRISYEGTRITRAEAVQQPKGGQSDQVNADAIPKLNAAVVAVQSAAIDSVSGATYTSEGYRKSLQSAIDKANQQALEQAAAQGGNGGGGAGDGGGAGTVTATGDVAQTQYGPVQVRITVANGRITKAEAVQQPKGGQSDQVNADAVPKLNAAAVAAGTADIDAVSGATYTSAGYKKSLQSALDKTKAQAGASGGQQNAGGSGNTGGGGKASAAKTVTGDVEQTQYGPVQVRITVANGRITKAEAVQQPKGGQSDQVNGDAIPKLNAAAVAAGSADIDAVSGATYTSAGYKKSLQSALDKAGA